MVTAIPNIPTAPKERIISPKVSVKNDDAAWTSTGIQYPKILVVYHITSSKQLLIKDQSL
jgi:hypothetical protein